ncbi:Aste57867_21947 [Aphanomyces stellatus]|uniref:Ethylmalonyl-CoA decarboxylase n=1 Tax=Aphanomyces stellatus TaxID=120398 RepID=A0A485LNS0_9STRA|nr:hypothetical protein As57867_021878 [Aphanomyces stellatus]VFT98615.1 Aste57867_21947 [Aphanomyces stellatus]
MQRAVHRHRRVFLTPVRRFSVRGRQEDIDYLRQLGQGTDHVTLYLPGDARMPLASALTRTAVVELHNPSARNAISGKMMAELTDAVNQLEELVHSLGCVVIRGSGGHFCAGADLRVAKDHLSSPEGGATMSRVMTHALTRFRRLPITSVAIVEGAAIGGGAEITTACDFRVMARSATIQFVHARMGVSPGWGGGARLVQLVGRQRSLRLLGRMEKLSSAEAHAMGLADEVVDDDAVDAGALAFLKPLDSHSPGTFFATSHFPQPAYDAALLGMLPTEHATFQRLWGGPANLAALANVAKR